jgi:hypothetical protein
VVATGVVVGTGVVVDVAVGTGPQSLQQDCPPIAPPSSAH